MLQNNLLAFLVRASEPVTRSASILS